MVVLQTYLLYTLLFAVMFLLAKIASDRNERIWIILAIVIYSIIFGMRYGVGVDHIAYLTEYQNISLALGDPFNDTEIGFGFLRDLLAKNGYHFTIFFTLIAFLQLWFVIKALKKSSFVYPYLITTFFLGCIWLTYANGLRQQLAFCIFAYSLLFVENKKQLPVHWALLLLATTMHNSAWLLFIIAPLLYIRTDWFHNVKAQYICLFTAIFIGMLPQMQSWLMLMEGNYGFLEEFMKETGYENYFEYEDGEGIFRNKGAVGVGYFIELSMNIIMIYFCNATKKFNTDNKLVTYMYNLTYVGILLHYAFIASPVLARINYYFYGFSYIFGAYTLHYLYHNKKNAFYVMSGLYVLVFMATLYRMYDNTSAFYFFWQQDLYLLNK